MGTMHQNDHKQARREAPKKWGVKIARPNLLDPPKKSKPQTVLGHFKMEIQKFYKTF